VHKQTLFSRNLLRRQHAESVRGLRSACSQVHLAKYQSRCAKVWLRRTGICSFHLWHRIPFSSARFQTGNGDMEHGIRAISRAWGSPSKEINAGKCSLKGGRPNTILVARCRRSRPFCASSIRRVFWSQERTCTRLAFPTSTPSWVCMCENREGQAAVVLPIRTHSKGILGTSLYRSQFRHLQHESPTVVHQGRPTLELFARRARKKAHPKAMEELGREGYCIALWLIVNTLAYRQETKAPPIKVRL